MNSQENKKSQIYRISDYQQFVQLIRDNPLLRILTNGKDVFAWKHNIASHDEVRQLFPEITNEWTEYQIENGHLFHSVKINFPVMDRFLCQWFPKCCEYIDDYNRKTGLNLFC